MIACTRAMNDFVFLIGHNIKSSSIDKYRPIWSKLDVTALKTETNERTNELIRDKHFNVNSSFRTARFLMDYSLHISPYINE